jgi:glycosyltransferase involved in cell wall biosynthesis
MAGLVRPKSIVTKTIHAANALMYRGLDAVITIGRDTEQLLFRYKGMTKDKVSFIPNWATLRVGVRPITPDNSYRSDCRAPFVVGLSGNLGFTHDPVVVFEAAKLLQSDRNIHFLLSGWGMGFEQLQKLQDEAKLPNVTMVGRVPDASLEEFLSAADIWIIPYRKNVAGVSVPSRFYNLLAIGRPVLIISEPEAEAALTVSEHDLGWVTSPGDSAALAETIRRASSARPELALKQERATVIAKYFSLAKAMHGYDALVRKLMTTA